MKTDEDVRKGVSVNQAKVAIEELYSACHNMAIQCGGVDENRKKKWVKDRDTALEFCDQVLDMLMKTSNDPFDGVEHPSHYQSDGGLECIDVMLDVFGADAVRTFARLNAFKYLWRAGKKDGQSTEKDLAKAAYYLSI